MNYNYILYDKLGLLVEKQVNPISKGNNNIDQFYFNFENKDFETGYLTFTATLPDGTSMPSAATSPAVFEYNGVEYKGYRMTLSNAYTQQAGTVTFTLTLKENKTNKALCSAQLSMVISDTDVAVPTSITETEKEQILQAIADGDKDLEDRKLDKNFTKYENVDDRTKEYGFGILYDDLNRKPKKVKANELINKVNSVNGKVGEVQLISTDIPHKNTNVGEELDRLEVDKANSADILYWRDGKLIPTELVPNGVLPCNSKESLPVGTWEVELTNSTFKVGDIISMFITISDNGTITQRNITTVFNGNISYPLVDNNGSVIYLNGTIDEFGTKINWSVNKAIVEISKILVVRV